MKYLSKLSNDDHRPFRFYNTVATMPFDSLPDTGFFDLRQGVDGSSETIERWLLEKLSIETFGHALCYSRDIFEFIDGWIDNSYSGFANEDHSCSAVLLFEQDKSICIESIRTGEFHHINVQKGDALIVPFELSRLKGVEGAYWIVGRFHPRKLTPKTHKQREDLIPSVTV